jgi:hypothetical protein
VQLASDGLEIRKFRPQDLTRLTALVAARDRTALPPGAPASPADVRAWLTGTVQQRLDGTGLHLVYVAASAGLCNTDWAAGVAFDDGIGQVAGKLRVVGYRSQ